MATKIRATSPRYLLSSSYVLWLAGMVASFAFDVPALGRVRRPQARCRLFCLPFPGAAASGFLPWSDLLPQEVELCALQLPGREDRFLEPLTTSFSFVVEEFLGAMAPYTTDLPFGLFGHSGGALLAFELARQLGAAKLPEPAVLFLSGESPADAPRQVGRSQLLPDTEFMAWLADRGGLAPEVAENAELMDLLLPVLRADFAWYEAYEYEPGPPLPFPVTAFAGRADPVVDVKTVAGWRTHTTERFELLPIDGAHFFIWDNRGQVVSHIAEALRATETSG